MALSVSMQKENRQRQYEAEQAKGLSRRALEKLEGLLEQRKEVNWEASWWVLVMAAAWHWTNIAWTGRCFESQCILLCKALPWQLFFLWGGALFELGYIHWPAIGHPSLWIFPCLLWSACCCRQEGLFIFSSLTMVFPP